MSPAMATLFATSYLIRPLREDDPASFGSAWWWIYLGISTFLVIFAGIMSGLTLGLMSISPVDLEVLQRSGTDNEKIQAAVIQPVVAKQHQLLVTLLLCNAASMEALPIFLDKMFNPVVAVILSVTFVLAFGEVIPQAVCTRYGLAIGANLVWLVKFLMVACFPIAYPVGKCLDYVLGHEEVLFRRAQLKALVSIHAKEAGKGGELSHDETTIISGALDLTEKTAEEAMTPIESTFSLDVSTKLDWEAMGKIITRGHSRIPVYSGGPHNIIGILLVKSLLTVRAEQETPVSAVSIRRIPRVPADMPLYDILNEFQKGSSHMAAVVKTKTGRWLQRRTSHIEAAKMSHSLSNKPEPDLEGGYISFAGDEDEARPRIDELSTSEGQASLENGSPPQEEWRQVENYGPGSDDVEEGEVIGIITLEDVIEELLQEEIVDETDEYVDVHKRIRVAAAAAQMAKHPQTAKSPSVRRVNSSRAVERRMDKVVSIDDLTTKGRGIAFRGKNADALKEPLLGRSAGV